jgi:hypothetical protein
LQFGGDNLSDRAQTFFVFGIEAIQPGLSTSRTPRMCESSLTSGTTISDFDAVCTRYGQEIRLRPPRG